MTAKAKELQSQLKDLAQEIVSDLSALDPEQSKELLGGFVSDLFLAVAEQTRKEERRQKQAKGIAAAKAKGVRFGRPERPMPDNFDQVRRAWRKGELSLQRAADTCGISRGTFYNAAVRAERAQEQAG